MGQLGLHRQLSVVPDPLTGALGVGGQRGAAVVDDLAVRQQPLELRARGGEAQQQVLADRDLGLDPEAPPRPGSMEAARDYAAYVAAVA